ncbi:hypothetical protein C8R45DRAFT_1224608 [Mycena sanguinolenta]|nr:hypothetical protein C8R45DRAFT_1224608 [Mycena sanguinolenta]
MSRFASPSPLSFFPDNNSPVARIDIWIGDAGVRHGRTVLYLGDKRSLGLPGFLVTQQPIWEGRSPHLNTRHAASPADRVGLFSRLGLRCFRFDRLARNVIEGGGVVVVIESSVGVSSSQSRIHPAAALVILPLVAFPICDLFLLGSFAACACAGHRRRRGPQTMPKDVSVSVDPELPFPGDYGPNGFATQYIRLGKLTNPQLSEHCKTFKLAHTGNKAALTDRLKSFSKDRLRWDSLLPGATNTHKGARKPQDEKKTKPKTSTIRRENLFQGAEGVRIVNMPATERSKDLRTAEEKAAILPWAKRIVEQYPYKPAQNHPDTNGSLYVRPQAVHPEAKSMPQLPCNGVPVIGSNGVAPAYNDVEMTDAPPLPFTVSQPVTALPISPPTSTASSNSISSGNTSTDGSAETQDDSPTRTLKLAGGKLITFHESDIPDPPAVSYASALETLLSEWDDNSSRWAGKSPLVINDTPVAIVYWPLVYKYWKVNQWKGIKKHWFDWKILVRAMTTAPNLVDFWTHYSTDKNLARSELTTEQLTYRKGGKMYVMTKASMIAAQYRRLKGLDLGDEDEDEDED